MHLVGDISPISEQGRREYSAFGEEVSQLLLNMAQLSKAFFLLFFGELGNNKVWLYQFLFLTSLKFSWVLEVSVYF